MTDRGSDHFLLVCALGHDLLLLRSTGQKTAHMFLRRAAAALLPKAQAAEWASHAPALSAARGYASANGVSVEVRLLCCLENVQQCADACGSARMHATLGCQRLRLSQWGVCGGAFVVLPSGAFSTTQMHAGVHTCMRRCMVCTCMPSQAMCSAGIQLFTCCAWLHSCCQHGETAKQCLHPLQADGIVNRVPVHLQTGPLLQSSGKTNCLGPKQSQSCNDCH